MINNRLSQPRLYWFPQIVGIDSTSQAVAVGTALSGRPPHRSQRAELPHWAPASGGDAQALFGIGMQDSQAGEPSRGQPVHALSRSSGGAGSVAASAGARADTWYGSIELAADCVARRSTGSVLHDRSAASGPATGWGDASVSGAPV